MDNLSHAEPLLAQHASTLPPPLRAKLLLALLGIVVVGIGLVAMVVLAGRAVKRLARQRNGRSQITDDAWYQKPLEGNADAGDEDTDHA